MNGKDDNNRHKKPNKLINKSIISVGSNSRIISIGCNSHAVSNAMNTAANLMT